MLEAMVCSSCRAVGTDIPSARPLAKKETQSMQQHSEHRPWWQGAVVYQIYPWSFQDSNGDGIGDLPGIISRLDHLNDGTPTSLGIDAIWLSPIYPSPMHDLGYDVADYCQVDPRFGTLADFDRFIQEAHRRRIRIIMDLVLNHTSDRHPWFVESRASRFSPKRHWYYWADGRSRWRRPSNWNARFGGSAWTWDAGTRQYYLHSFLKQQPDLNWNHPEVRRAMWDIVQFWLDRGVDGFRLDAINWLGKDSHWPDNPFRFGLRGYTRQLHRFDRDLPPTHEACNSSGPCSSPIPTSYWPEKPLPTRPADRPCFMVPARMSCISRSTFDCSSPHGTLGLSDGLSWMPIGQSPQAGGPPSSSATTTNPAMSLGTVGMALHPPALAPWRCSC